MQSPNCVSQTLMMTVRHHADDCPTYVGMCLNRGELDASGDSRSYDDRKEDERKEAPGRQEYEKGDILEDDEDDEDDGEEKRRAPGEDDDDVLRTGPARDRGSERDRYH